VLRIPRLLRIRDFGAHRQIGITSQFRWVRMPWNRR